MSVVKAIIDLFPEVKLKISKFNNVTSMFDFMASFTCLLIIPQEIIGQKQKTEGSFFVKLPKE